MRRPPEGMIGDEAQRGGRFAAVSPAGELEPTPAQPGTPPVASPAVIRIGPHDRRRRPIRTGSAGPGSLRRRSLSTQRPARGPGADGAGGVGGDQPRPGCPLRRLAEPVGGPSGLPRTGQLQGRQPCRPRAQPRRRCDVRREPTGRRGPRPGSVPGRVLRPGERSDRRPPGPFARARLRRGLVQAGRRGAHDAGSAAGARRPGVMGAGRPPPVDADRAGRHVVAPPFALPRRRPPPDRDLRQDLPRQGTGERLRCHSGRLPPPPARPPPGSSLAWAAPTPAVSGEYALVPTGTGSPACPIGTGRRLGGESGP